MSFNFRSNISQPLPKRNAYVPFGSNFGELKGKSKPGRGRKSVKVPNLDFPIPVHLNKHLSKEAKINHLKKKLLTGQDVTHSQINIVAYGDKDQRKRNIDMEKEIHMTDSEILSLSPPGKQELYVNKGIVSTPTPHRPGVLKNTFGTPNELRVSTNGVDTEETLQRCRYFVDMSGFLDGEINLALQGRKLLIFGERPKSKSHNAKSTSEVIRLPPGLQVDNLRAVRDCFGTVILEEAWKF